MEQNTHMERLALLDQPMHEIKNNYVDHLPSPFGTTHVNNTMLTQITYQEFR
ncbi:hypothetical protein HYC85_015455 [Camellia sinensis]|uniref:Uncharacterized protein n=1 Tax=Camellia sinensis TaxID=4442 RepID=A0A7J7GXU6_CAMSI|nr:hypothetical protein HYC85_015455 [Camellia sinensis]